MGLFSRKKPEAQQPEQGHGKWKDLSPAEKEFQRNVFGITTEEEWERSWAEQEGKSRNIALLKSIGTYDMDSILEEYAPKHEQKLNQIIKNQEQILAELADLRQFYMKPENAKGTTYQNPYNPYPR